MGSLASKGFEYSAQELEPYSMGIRELSKGSQMPRPIFPNVHLGCHMVVWGWQGDRPQGWSTLGGRGTITQKGRGPGLGVAVGREGVGQRGEVFGRQMRTGLGD